MKTPKQKKTYYKVVTDDSRGLTSARAGGFGSAVKYHIGEWVEGRKDKYGENTRLFVFDDLNDAKKFRDDLTESIFECEIEGSIKGYGASSWSGITQFWNNFGKFLKMKKSTKGFFETHTSLTRVPAILAKRVKLTKLVD